MGSLAVIVACQSRDPRTDFRPAVHRYHNPQVGFLNAYLVETADGVVAVDAGFLTVDAQGIRAIVDSVGKPLQAILLTHGHPDHYGGAAALRGDGAIPVIATRAVDHVIRRDDVEKAGRFQPLFQQLYPTTRLFPTRIARDRERFVFGGVAFEVRDLGPAESDADAYWVASGGGRQVAFIGDLVLHRVHALFQDGHTGGWLNALARVTEELSGVDSVFPGHGEPGTFEMLGWQADYIREYREGVRELMGRDGTVADAALPALRQRMLAVLPSERLSWAVPASANVVAAELRHEAARQAVFERMLRFSTP